MTARKRTTIEAAAIHDTSTTAPAARLSGLFNEQAINQFSEWLIRFADPDETLRKAGLSRANLRALEYDDEVSQCLETRREALVSTPWRLEPQQTRVSRWLTDEITPHIEPLIRSVFNAVPYGYSVSEVVYVERNGRIGIDRLSEKPFEWFEPKNDGSLVYRPMQGGEVTVDPRKFLLTRRSYSYRQPYGEAMLSRLYWVVFFKSNARKFWAKFLERFGEPVLVGRVADQEKFIKDVATLGLAAGLPIQPGDDVSSIAVSQAGEFERFEGAMSRSIQKVILGQTLTSDVGSSGSYAAAKVHDSVRTDKRNADLRLVTGTVQQLIDNLSELNGFQAPRFTMADDTGLEGERAQRDAQLSQYGVLKFTEQYLLDRYDFNPGDFIVPQDNPAKTSMPTKLVQTLPVQTGTFTTFSAPSQATNTTTVDLQSQTLGKTFDPAIADWTKHIAHRLADMGDMQALAAWLGQGAWDELPTGDMVKSLQQALTASQLAGQYEASIA